MSLATDFDFDLLVSTIPATPCGFYAVPGVRDMCEAPAEWWFRMSGKLDCCGRQIDKLIKFACAEHAQRVMSRGIWFSRCIECGGSGDRWSLVEAMGRL